MPVGEMLARMSQRELVEWQIRNKTHPLGDWREDLRFGMAVSPIINLMRQYLIKNPELTKPADWIMKFGPQKRQKPQDWRQIKQVLMGLAGKPTK
jgi:hypothetical protein